MRNNLHPMDPYCDVADDNRCANDDCTNFIAYDGLCSECAAIEFFTPMYDDIGCDVIDIRKVIDFIKVEHVAAAERHFAVMQKNFLWPKITEKGAK